ncbi:biotin transporter BioY [Nonomuraea lactucae]|uniref:biotin transporter BioY n=1 Tax=Nonomuraea lactucae TaxID=2249762 RepID=UPI000DE20F68|nr:biotin transporter BioY [Nonomuraea lactucae]
MASTPVSIHPAVLSDLLPGSRVRDVALVIAGAGLTGLAAQLTFPTWPVPVTGQTFAVLLTGAALGMNRAAASMLLYLVAGIAGVPWFAGGSAGFGGASFGYLLGFIAAAAIVGKLAELGKDRKVLSTVGIMALGNLVIYAFGLPVLIAVTKLDLGTALVEGAGKFLLGDAIKIAVAAGVLPLAWKLARPSR